MKVAAAIVALSIAPSLLGQAWIAPRGETSVSLTFQRTEFQGHFYFDSSKVPHGGSHSRSLALGIEHSLTDRLAISASIPFVGSENGIEPQPVLGRSGIDDGNYHSTWQDFRFGARYNLFNGPVVVTPSLSLRIPSHRYPTIGEAAVGPRLRETTLGADVGKVFSPAGLDFYADGAVSYSWVQKFAGIGMNRSNEDLDVGYFASPKLNLRAVLSWQQSYGGITADRIFSPAGPPVRNPNISDVLWVNHDRLLRDDYFRAGLGATMSIADRAAVYATAMKMVSGTNSHYGYLYAIGVSRTFNGAHVGRAPSL